MITPKTADIGRIVVYRDARGGVEQGVVASFNDDYVFVRYGMGCTSAATRHENLEWLYDGPKEVV
jgi:hypothetical protein